MIPRTNEKNSSKHLRSRWNKVNLGAKIKPPTVLIVKDMRNAFQRIMGEQKKKKTRKKVSSYTEMKYSYYQSLKQVETNEGHVAKKNHNVRWKYSPV